MNDLEAVKNIAENLNFSFDQGKARLQIERNLHRIVLEIIDENGQILLLKYLLQVNEPFLTKFQQETDVLTELSRAKVHFHFNEIFKSGTEPKPWFVCSCLQGVTLGNSFQFDSKYLSENFSDFLVGALREISQTTPVESDSSKFDRIKKVFGKASLSQSMKKYEDNLNQYLLDSKELLADQANYVFAHNDLTPLNILKTPSGYGIIDWESSQTDLLTHDAAYLFHRAWGNSVWQENFQSKLFRKLFEEKDQSLFLLEILELLVYDISVFEKMLDQNNFAVYHNDDLSEAKIRELHQLFLSKLDQFLAGGLK
ncbi:MAG: phosphotransferase [Candidatus Berkelbacteria bacterium]|nr:phosphotransferase [Candidatus Berkelbacteria bacterium]